MNTTFSELSESEQRAIMAICILAAFADGNQSEQERAEIRRIAGRFASEGFDLTGAYQEALAGTLRVDSLAGQLSSPNARALGYEMALSTCNADHALTQAEQEFLIKLRAELKLDKGITGPLEQSAATLAPENAAAEPPLLADVKGKEIDDLITNRAILAGALELMPQKLATMAIIPVQIRMVYQIGKTFGYTLDISHAKEFLAAAGLGLTSQVLESYLTRAVQGLVGRFTGKVPTGLVGQVAQSGLAFTTTYAIGQAAKSYYSGGRTLSSGQIRSLFSSMLDQGRSLQGQFTDRIAQQSRQLTPSNLLSLVQKS